MTGKYTLEIFDRRVHYQFDLQRNITIIQGDSGTGKTNLLSMIRDYERLGEKSGVTVRCEKACSTIPFAHWEAYLSQTHDHIFFVDEDMPFIRSERFAKLVNQMDDYIVICCRDALPQLAYSIQEIYGMRENKGRQKYVHPKRVYNELYCLYHLQNYSAQIRPDYVITEDQNAGNAFFSHYFTCPCVSAGGKDKVWKKVLELYREDPARKLLAIVDGAAFGANINKLYESVQYNHIHCTIYAPESFEYLIMASHIVEVPADILEHTYNYADS